MRERGWIVGVRPDSRARPASALATTGVLLSVALPAAGLAAASPGALAAARAPGADSSALVAALALVLAWVVVARLAVTAAAVLLAHVPGALGAAAARVAVVASPAVLRSLVRVAAGAAVVAAPVTAGTAALADAGPSPTASVRVLTAGALPVLDRFVPAPAPGPTRPARPRTIVVRSGDTLWSIAERSLPAGCTGADVARAWPRWFAANRTVIGADPALIRPGEVLTPPQT